MNINNQDTVIIELHNKGKSVKDIEKITTFSKSKIYNVIKAYKSGISIDYKKRGRKEGEKRKIPESFLNFIITQKPDNNAWTVNLIKSKLYMDDIVVAVNTIKSYLKRHNLYKVIPSSYSKNKPKHFLWVSMENYVYSDKSQGIFCCAYDEHNKYYFLFYNKKDMTQQFYKDENINYQTAVLFDFIRRCSAEKRFENILVYSDNDKISQSVVAEKWTHLNKHYKTDITEPKIKQRK